MSHLIEVAFKGNRKEFFLWDGDDPPRLQAAVIVDGDRGEDLGHVHATGELAAKRFAGVPHGGGPTGAVTKHAQRLATPDEVVRAAELVEENESARRRAAERVKANGLVMKLTDADWQWDRRKLTFYFTAERRVDFRNLVRDLAALFRTRIELKQIGVRDEAKRLDGVGRCGRQYCSASWLPELRPVNLGVAKDQRLSLNPTQISGACGRLMCCLRYEHEFYVQSRKRFPKEGKILVTLRGEEKVMANDIFNDRVTLRSPEGETRMVPLADLRRETSEAAESAAGGMGDATIDGDDGDDGETHDAHDGHESHDELAHADEPSSAARGPSRASPAYAQAPVATRPVTPRSPLPVVDRAPQRPERPERPERPQRVEVPAARDDAGRDAPAVAPLAVPVAVPVAELVAELATDEPSMVDADAGSADDAGDDATPPIEGAVTREGEAARLRRRRGRRGGRRGGRGGSGGEPTAPGGE